MTTSNILSQAAEINCALDNHEITAAQTLLRKLMGGLQEDIRKAECSSKGALSALKAAQRILKTSSYGVREELKFPWTDEQGRQILCDGFRLARLNEPLPLPERPADLQYINYPAFLEPARNGRGQQLEAPDVKELRAHIKTVKPTLPKGGVVKWDFGDGLPMVDAQYLLELLALLPGAALYCTGKNPLISPIYFESESGDGVLLPVKKG